LNDHAILQDEKSSPRIGVISKIGTKVFKSVLLDYNDSSPELLTSKLLYEHVFKMTGI
jgi:hypothetical protein